MSMKLHPQIIGRAPRLGYTTDAATDKKAKEEGSNYEYQKINDGYYACISGANTYIIEVTNTTIGCSCPAMTHRKTEHHLDACKHILALSELSITPQEPTTEETKKLLRWDGWIGEDIMIPPESYQSQARKKQKKQKPEQRAARANDHERWKGMTPAQMCEAMDDKELAKNANRGGVAAIAEQEKRKKEAMI